MTVIEIIKKLRFQDIVGSIKILSSFIPGKIWKLFCKDMWVVAEYDVMARDNGYWFFKYMRENHPEKQVYYPISKASPDYKKIADLGGDVTHGSFKHYCLFWAAKYFCSSSSVQGFPYYRICKEFVIRNLHGFKYIFLNHGITRGYSGILDGRYNNYDLICTCSVTDKNIIAEDSYQNPERIKVTGFARHDNLINYDTNKKQVLIMPTWRNWLSYRNEVKPKKIEQIKKNFLNSSYYQKYNSLINSADLISFLEEYDLKVVFYLHQYAQVYADYFETTSERITIGKPEEYDVQTLLKDSCIMITDYSSVCYDFAYMHKPVIYYQFDRAEFEENQYAPGSLFSYEEKGFGEICESENELIQLLKKARMESFQMKNKYVERVENYFEFFDTSNCERIYQAIESMSE